MKRTAIAALGAAMIATLGASSATRAATVDFGVGAFDGSITFTGPSLDQSTALDLDLAFLVVMEVGADDESGLALFDLVTLSPTQIIYGSGVGPGSLGADVTLKWPMVIGPGTDAFTETLTTVTSINRATSDQIALKLTGTVNDSDGLFVNAPVLLSLTASQALGSIQVGFTNASTSVTPSVPEASTWAMMALGFAALGCVGFRKRLNLGRVAGNGAPSV